jgi:hypothetical protein
MPGVMPFLDYGVVSPNNEALTVPIHVTAQYRSCRALRVLRLGSGKDHYLTATTSEP